MTASGEETELHKSVLRCAERGAVGRASSQSPTAQAALSLTYLLQEQIVPTINIPDLPRSIQGPQAADEDPDASGPDPNSAVKTGAHHVHTAVLRLHAGASGVCVRGAAAGRQPGEARPLPVVAPGLRPPPQERVRAQSQSRGGLPQGKLPRALQDPGEPPVLPAQPPQAAAAVAQGALRGGREAARAAAGSRGQVPGPEKISASPDHLGRRGDQLLLQGEVPGRAAGVVHAQPLPVPAREARTGRGHGAHHHTGQQLVQEPAAAGPGRGGQREGEQREQRRGREQAEPAVASGRSQVSHVQFRGRVLPAAEPGAELCALTAGEHVSSGGICVPHVRPGRASAGARHARTPAPAAGLLVGTSNLQSCGSRLLKDALGCGCAQRTETCIRV